MYAKDAIKVKKKMITQILTLRNDVNNCDDLRR